MEDFIVEWDRNNLSHHVYDKMIGLKKVVEDNVQDKRLADEFYIEVRENTIEQDNQILYKPEFIFYNILPLPTSGQALFKVKKDDIESIIPLWIIQKVDNNTPNSEIEDVIKVISSILEQYKNEFDQDDFNKLKRMRLSTYNQVVKA